MKRQLQLSEGALLAAQTFLSKYHGKQSLGIHLAEYERALYDFLSDLETGRNWAVPSIQRAAARDQYFTDSALELLSNPALKDTTVVSLGSGFSCLDLALEGQYGSFVNVDWTDVNEAKRAMYEELVLGTPKIHYVGCNIEKLDPKDILEGKGNLLVIMEGITYYLSPETNSRIFRSVKERNGVLILDIFIDGMTDGSTPYPDANAVAGELKRGGDVVRWTSTPEQLEGKLQGLKVEKLEPITKIVGHYGISQNPFVYIATASS